MLSSFFRVSHFASPFSSPSVLNDGLKLRGEPREPPPVTHPKPPTPPRTARVASSWSSTMVSEGLVRPRVGSRSPVEHEHPHARVVGTPHLMDATGRNRIRVPATPGPRRPQPVQDWGRSPRGRAASPASSACAEPPSRAGPAEPSVVPALLLAQPAPAAFQSVPPRPSNPCHSRLRPPPGATRTRPESAHSATPREGGWELATAERRRSAIDGNRGSKKKEKNEGRRKEGEIGTKYITPPFSSPSVLNDGLVQTVAHRMMKMEQGGGRTGPRWEASARQPRASLRRRHQRSFPSLQAGADGARSEVRWTRLGDEQRLRGALLGS